MNIELTKQLRTELLVQGHNDLSTVNRVGWAPQSPGGWFQLGGLLRRSLTRREGCKQTNKHDDGGTPI